jgi:DNA processing protein
MQLNLGLFGLAEAPSHATVCADMPRRSFYNPPKDITRTTVGEILATVGRPNLSERMSSVSRKGAQGIGPDAVPVYFAGDYNLLGRPCVSVVGTRDVSDNGRRRASRVARELADNGAVVVSGLARGVDTIALISAIEAGGRAIAVIGTPLSKAYPAENFALQEEIWRHHLLMSPFAEGEQVFKANFPKRNKVMAAISDATVIVEASDTSGTLHQAAECQRRGRWLFIMEAVAEDESLSWPMSFLGTYERARILRDTKDIISAITADR